MLAAVGITLVIAGLGPFLYQRSPAQLASSAAVPDRGPGTSNISPAMKKTVEHVPRAVHVLPPRAVFIPTLDVRADLSPLPVSDTGELGVPAGPDEIGYWYQPPKHGTRVQSAKVRPTVLVGHLDSLTGPAVFYDLASLRPGDVVVIWDAGGQHIRYAITSVEEVPRNAFPAKRVYGATKHPELRLLTCAGEYVGSGYTSNAVVYARAVRA